MTPPPQEAAPDLSARSAGPLSPLKRIWLYNGTLTLIALALFLGPAAPHQPWGRVEVPWWCITIGLILVSLFPARVHSTRALTLLVANEVPLVVAVVCAPSDATLLALVVARVVLLLRNRFTREPLELFKDYFNLASGSVEVLLAYTIFGALAGRAYGSIAEVTVWLTVVLLLAELAHALVSSCTVPLAILSYTWDRHVTDGMAARLTLEIPYSLASTSLGVVIVEGLLGQRALLLAGALPIMGLLFFGRQSAAVRRDQAQADQLQQLSAELLIAPSLREATELLLRRACGMFLAADARMVLLPSTQAAAAYQSMVRDRGGFSPMAEMTLSDVDRALIALLQERGRPLSHRQSDPPALRDYLSANRLANAMVALVMSAEEAAALLVIGPRSGTSSSRYTAVEETTLATVAAQVGSVFENSRLTNQLDGLMGRSAELEHQAFHDPLTDLPNRALLMDRLGQAMVRRNRAGSIGVIFVDVDDFKPINDTLGHAAGDAVLVEIAHRLQRAARGEDTAARLGGDEFVVMLSELRDPAEMEMIAQRVLALVSQPIEYEGKTMHLTVSLGAATGEAGEGVERLLARADNALYEAKRAGKGRVAVRHSSSMPLPTPTAEVDETAS